MNSTTSQPVCSTTRASSRQQLIICVDFGGSNIRMSTAQTDGNKKPTFRLVKKWPGRAGESDHVPNLVVASKETGKPSWGYIAENALLDDPSNYVAHYNLKRHLMKLSQKDSDPDETSKENASLALISGLLQHAIGTLRPTSLLIIVAVPTHVGARGANRYLNVWPQASPIDSENTTVWVADEAEMGSRGAEMTALPGTNGEHDRTLHTRVDLGSTTMVSAPLQRTRLQLTAIRMSVYRCRDTLFLQKVCSMVSTR